jgi:DNA protecting protein DprA
MDLPQPPHWLFVQGSLDVLRRPSIAIVGTRKPTDDGLFLARYVGACLADWQAPTVSGLANGIDQLAHESSIRAGVPTIAVLGTGILDNYPKGSDILREKILRGGGAIISEYLPRESYSAANFVQRNRLQSALGRVLVPVEWARRSGTAHTVRFASDLRRPIACLRLSDWAPERVVMEPGQGHDGGTIFTLPSEHRHFDAFIRGSLVPEEPTVLGQLSLFGEA